ncbi:MAG: hypothetical protein J3R72DRAFT_421685 [Linnemannia gamsii]|nr:MAG: hypothetical protein J3R72DRAFT_421685 [Linnemannia gamsii]
MNIALNLQKKTLSGYLEEIKTHEEHEFAWAQVFYPCTFNPIRDHNRKHNHNNAPPSFVTQDNPAARFALYTACHDIVNIYTKIQKTLMTIKATEPWSRLVSHYKQILTNACVLKFGILEEEHRAYLDDHELAQTTTTTKGTAGSEIGNAEAMVWTEHLIK